MSKSGLVIQYRDLRKDMASFPKGSVMYKKIDEKLHLFLKETQKKYGQDVVDQLTGGLKKGKAKVTKKPHTNGETRMMVCEGVIALKSYLGKMKRYSDFFVNDVDIQQAVLSLQKSIENLEKLKLKAK